MRAQPEKGKVYLVGAGPGALDLFTLRARDLIKTADVVIYDYLCNPQMLLWAPAQVEKIYVGKSAANHTFTQEEINQLLVARGRAGQQVVRLKGGDPYVFGRGGEEAQELRRAEVEFEVVPGVTSAIAAPAYAGIPVTHRELASTVTFVTGHEDPTKADSAIDWPHLARLRGTKIFLMGVEKLRVIAEKLIVEGVNPKTPVALVRWGTTARQETVAGTLLDIADLVEKQAFKAPAVTIVGEVVNLRPELNWYEKLPLLGQRVVVTRTRQQSSPLVEKLTRLGADVLEIPTIKIVPQVLNGTQQNKLKAMRDHFEWIVFTSPNGVECFFREFFRVSRDLRQLGAVKIAVVGPATAKKVKELHLSIDLQPEIFTTEHLAHAFTEDQGASTRFCLPKGQLADPYLADGLRKKGAFVDEWIVYHTIPEEGDLTGARTRYLREGAHWITFTSSSTAENWHQLYLQPNHAQPRPKVISMGALTSATLKRLQYEIAGEAPESTLDSLVETICRLI